MWLGMVVEFVIPIVEEDVRNGVVLQLHREPIFTLQFGTSWIESFHRNGLVRGSPIIWPAHFTWFVLVGCMKDILMFCHYPPLCQNLLRWWLLCLQICGQNLNTGVLCAWLVITCALKFLWWQESTKYCQAGSHVRYFRHANISETDCISILRVQCSEDENKVGRWNSVTHTIWFIPYSCSHSNKPLSYNVLYIQD